MTRADSPRRQGVAFAVGAEVVVVQGGMVRAMVVRASALDDAVRVRCVRTGAEAETTWRDAESRYRLAPHEAQS